MSARLALAHGVGVVEGLLRADQVLRGESRIPLAPLAHIALQRHEREGWLERGQIDSYRDPDGWLIVERYDGTRRKADGRPEAVFTRLFARELTYYRRQIALARQLGVDSDDVDAWEARCAWLVQKITDAGP